MLSRPLTPRELQVISLIAKGLSNREISGVLQTSEHTAKFHVANIAKKLNVNRRTEIAVSAIKMGLA